MSDYSWLFGNGSSGMSNSNGINLSDYAMIKNGSYKKLMKAYYSETKSDNKGSTSKTKDTTSKATVMQSDATSLKKSIDALNKNSLWVKKDITSKDEAGNTTTGRDYDWEAITKAVESFVNDYNETIDKAGNANTLSVLNDALSMTKTTLANEKLLSDAGIKIGTENKLTLDKEALKSADIGTLKTLFLGQNSYAGRIGVKASSISNAAARISGTYTNNGTYSNILASRVSGKVDEDI